MDAEVRAGARLDAIVARGLVDLEQQAVGIDEALGILVRDALLLELIGTRDERGDRREDVGAVRRPADERILVGHTRSTGHTRDRVLVLEIGIVDLGVGDLIEIAASPRERRENLPVAVDHLTAPFGLRDDPIDFCASIACQRHRVTVEAQFATEDRIGRIVAVIDDR